MAVVRPFRALRPEPGGAAAVAAVPYDVVTADEARELVAGAPLSFLRVTRPEVDLAPDIDPHDSVVYEMARANLAMLRGTAPLVIEAQPAIYVYRLGDEGHEQTGLAGCFSLDEYERDTIKKHERTRPDKEDDRTKHILTVGAQTGVVFLTYREIPDLDAEIAAVCQEPPLFDFEATDGVCHTIWRATEEQTTRLVEGFAAVPALYIADGHHRAASANRARRTLRVSLGEADRLADRDSFVAVAFPDRQTRILPYNRTLSNLAGATTEHFLETVSERLSLEPSSTTIPEKGSTSMYIGGCWYRVELGDVCGGGLDQVASLDVSMLQERVLGPVLGVTDIRTDPRVHFVGGVRGTSELERLVDCGEAAVAFSLAAVTVPELLAIADAGAIMPPKSTWFEPKLRDGLLTHLI